MSIYSYTTLGQLSAAYISTRTCNACKDRNMLTVKAVWDHYHSHRHFRSISGVGKKGEAQLLRIVRKAAGVMSVMPLTVTADAPGGKQGFSFMGWYASLNEEGRQIANNMYARFVMHLRANSQRKLEDQCGDLTLASFLQTMSADDKLFHSYTRTFKGCRSEIGQMIHALYSFLQSDLYNQYMEKPTLTLLRQEMHKLMGCLSKTMDEFLVRQGERLTEPTFPLGSFVGAVIQATTHLPANTKKRWKKMLHANASQPLLVAKMCAMIRESNLFSIIQPAIALLEKFGYTMPSHYHLQDAPYYTSHYSGPASYNDFGSLFITLLYNPSYSVAIYRNGFPHFLLVRTNLLEQFAFTDFLREVIELKSRCIHEAYSIDLMELMESYFEGITTVEEDEKLMPIVAALVEDIYGLTTNSEGGLELKRTSKKQTWEHILEVLTDNGKWCTTREIREELAKRDIHVTTDTVRNNMADHKDLFNHTGDGEWGLKTWKQPERVVNRFNSHMMIVK